ncbi:MAG: outer membrane protein assembly factor BamD [Candidatus Latescibacteria bacterium]|nr:outer membrane protein assembly factor BamD [Candidatus Latescibacterota bacterium]NIM20956.1 outer membrane protein assembly factor BamD [Candidatus Latescibacterota bacterium]NIM65091.1 outer membrane protein assembly factor BamD [Candidatus Latescibacterota bacterium]NIO01606.1 outer membrane protein assembly factor BamD [Candidatus Latescibacterota bacterium]NIO28123.1 outer membrane protein assembly factor BamD [Candidatus Latescibacterota bacterium]
MNFARPSGVRAILLTVAFSNIGCAGGIPSIPNQPEAILSKGEQQFQKGKYFQAQELFKGFLAKHPGHDKSDYAQFMLAESYFKDEEYPLAAVEYRIIISDYGYSEYVDDALFKEALCFFEQAPKSHLDQTKSFEALSRFRQFLQTFPQSTLVEDVQRYVAEIHEKLAEKDFKNAMFYVRRKFKSSAMIYLNKVIEQYPGNDYWARAMYHKGQILLEQGDKEGAATMFEGVVNYSKELDITDDAKAELARLRDK